MAVREQRRRTGGQQSPEFERDREMPQVQAPITGAHADPGTAARFARVIAQNDHILQEHVDRIERRNAIRAKKKAIEDGAGLGEDALEERLDDFSRNEAEAYLGTQTYLEGTEDRAEMVRQIHEAEPGQKMETADRFMEEALVDASEQEIDTILPMLVKARDDAIASDLQHNRRQIQHEAATNIGDKVRDVIDNEGELTPENLKQLRQTAREMPTISEAEGTQAFIGAVVDRAVETGRPELVQQTIDGSEGELTAEQVSQLESAKERAEAEKAAKDDIDVAMAIDQATSKADNGMFTAADGQRLMDDETLNHYFDNERVASLLRRSRQAREQIAQEHQNVQRWADAFAEGTLGERATELEATSQNDWDKLYDFTKRHIGDHLDAEGVEADRDLMADTFILSKAAQNGPDAEFSQIRERMNNGILSTPSESQKANGEVPDGFARAADLWEATENNPQARKGLTRHMSKDAKQSALLYNHFRHMNDTGDRPAEEVRREAYYQTIQARENAQAMDRSVRNELEAELDDEIDDMRPGMIASLFTDEAGRGPEVDADSITPEVESALKQRGRRFLKLTGNVEQAKKLGVESFKQDHEKLEDVWVPTNGRGLHPQSEEMIQELKQDPDWQDQMARRLDVAPEDFDPNDIRYIPDPRRPEVMMPVFRMWRPLPQFAINANRRAEERRQRQVDESIERTIEQHTETQEERADRFQPEHSRFGSPGSEEEAEERRSGFGEFIEGIRDSASETMRPERGQR